MLDEKCVMEVNDGENVNVFYSNKQGGTTIRIYSGLAKVVVYPASGVVVLHEALRVVAIIRDYIKIELSAYKG